jgi:precorrin-3B methylase
VLPNNFDLRRLREARVCNVVVSLYNRSADPALTARFDRALELLRKHC